MRTYVFRLYPTKAQQRRLMACLIDSRHLYNEMLDRVKAHHQETGKFLSKYDLNNLFKGRGGENVPASTVQCLSDRLDKALRWFVDRRRSGCGFPRFKKGNQWHSIHLRQHATPKMAADFSVVGRHLRIPGKLGGAIKIKRHREIVGTPKTCWLVLKADGHWYAKIVCEVPQEPVQHATGASVGLDVGLKVFLADSEGNTVENPRHYRKAQAALRRKQRRLSARAKGGKRWHKAARAVAQTYLKVSRQRRDFHHKVARQYADRYGLIAVEDLNVSAMVHGNLAKSIYDAGWSAFLEILTYKAESAGGQVVRVKPHYTTQKCSRCGEHVQKSLSVRTHICPHCGYVADRDVNAARNVLRAGAQPSGTLPVGAAVEPRSC